MKNKVLICEDLLPIGKKYEFILNREKDIEVVGIASSGKEAVNLALQTKPNVILMDIEMETPLAGIEASRSILSALPDTKIIVLTVHRNDELIFQAFGAGVVDYMYKNSSPENIVESVRNAQNNASTIHPEISKRLRSEFRRLQTVNSSLLETFNKLFRLSRTELEVLELFLHGMTRSEVAQQRMVEISTTKSQIRSILSKTEYNSIQELVAVLQELNLASFIHNLLSHQEL